MGRLDIVRGARIFQGLSKRIRALPPGVARKIRFTPPGSATFRRRAFAGGLLATSLVLGMIAEDRAKAQALWDFNHSRSPTLRIWEHALLAHGYARVIEPRRLETALRSLPATLDSSNGAWVAPDLGWIAILGQENTTDSASVYCLRPACDGKPTTWEPQGAGWEGFDQVLANIERSGTATGRKAIRLRGRSRVAFPLYRDAREIRY